MLDQINCRNNIVSIFSNKTSIDKFKHQATFRNYNKLKIT